MQKRSYFPKLYHYTLRVTFKKDKYFDCMFQGIDQDYTNNSLILL